MEHSRTNISIILVMPSVLEKLSILVNKWIYKEEGNPICYTVYREKSAWYKIFNACFFWQKNHCRKVYLMKRIHFRRDKE